MRFRDFFNLLVLVCVAVLFVVLVSRAIKRPQFDLVIQGGTIVDGQGKEPYRADIGIYRGKIKKIGKPQAFAGKKATRTLLVKGLMVCPGFIDLHTHAERKILEHPDAHNFIHQGVTTVLGGNCGGSPYPIGAFLEKVEKKKIALNFCTLVGHNTIRRKVMGNAGRAATEDELQQMRKMVAQAMKDGAFGLSTGLKYMPGAFAQTGEIIELAREVQGYGGFYATHMREEGLDILESIEETLAIAKATHIPIQISHHKITSVEMWGSSKQTLALIEKARASGFDIMLDQYPYPATSTGLTVLFPAWSLEGTPAERLKRWNDATLRPRLVADIKNNIETDRGGNDLERIMISRFTPGAELEGLTIKEILEKKKLPVTMENGVELIIQLQSRALEEKGEASAIYFCLSDEDIERIMQYKNTIHASDGAIQTFAVGNPHPRNYGTFARVFAVYVREKGILTFAEAVKKMTTLPARRLGLKKRGRIAEGNWADITIIDAEKVTDAATWQRPHQYPRGIPYVIVNGEIVIENNDFTGQYPGQVLKSK